MNITTYFGGYFNGLLVRYSYGNANFPVSGVINYLSNFTMALSSFWGDLTVVNIDAIQFRFLFTLCVFSNYVATTQRCFGG